MISYYTKGSSDGYNWYRCGTFLPVLLQSCGGVTLSKELGTRYKNYISSGVRLNVTPINCT